MIFNRKKSGNYIYCVLYIDAGGSLLGRLPMPGGIYSRSEEKKTSMDLKKKKWFLKYFVSYRLVCDTYLIHKISLWIQNECWKQTPPQYI